MTNSSEKDNIIIRRDDTGDSLRRIVDLDRECFPSESWGSTVWSGLFDNRQHTVFLADFRNGLVGYCTLISTVPEAEILRIGVITEFRRRSIGTNLLNSVIHDLKSKGISELFLEVRSDNRPACELYWKYGFNRIGERKQYYKTPPGDALIFQRLIIQ